MAISDHTGGRLLKISLCWMLLAVLATTPRAVEGESTTEVPTPKPWPDQFHSILMMNYTGILQIIDLWYDWPGGRNLNLIQKQLGSVLHDAEWNNGTSFFYTLNENGSGECSSAQLEVGILRPNWLNGATYIGRRNVDGFLCNVWEKADFITYYEDVVTNRPVHWVFYTGREAHVMTFEVGAVLEDFKWQAPSYCFQGHNYFSDVSYIKALSLLPSSSSSINKVLLRRGSSRSKSVF